MGFFQKLIRKPFAILVVFVGLLYVGLSLLADVVQIFLLGLFFSNPLFVLALIFDLAFFSVAFLALREKRSSFIASAAVSIVFLILFAPAVADAITNPTHPAFRFVISGVPALLVVAIFSVLSMKHARTGLAQKRYLVSPQSTGGLFTTAVIGFVIGSLVIGTISAGIIVRILAQAGTAADIQIVRGASEGAAAPFDPASFPANAGEEVSWFNADTVGHSVTSDDGTFDSGVLQPGDRWTWTFSQPGTYTYHCTPHPYMTGTIVVT